MGQMQERITTTKKGSITSVQAVYVPADDCSFSLFFSTVSSCPICFGLDLRSDLVSLVSPLLVTDPAPATTFAHLDATTVLSRGIAELGIYPAVDPLDSKSRMLDPRIVGIEHYGSSLSSFRVVVLRSLEADFSFRRFVSFLQRSPPRSRRSSRTTSLSRISLPFLVWMS